MKCVLIKSEIVCFEKKYFLKTSFQWKANLVGIYLYYIFELPDDFQKLAADDVLGRKLQDLGLIRKS